MVLFEQIRVQFILIGIVLFAINFAKSSIVPTRNLIYNSNGLGAYSFAYETEDGSFRREEGGNNPIDGSLVVRGEFGYLDHRGRLYTVHYIADANGFHPLTSDDTRFNDRNIV